VYVADGGGVGKKLLSAVGVGRPATDRSIEASQDPHTEPATGRTESGWLFDLDQSRRMLGLAVWPGGSNTRRDQRETPRAGVVEAVGESEEQQRADPAVIGVGMPADGSIGATVDVGLTDRSTPSLKRKTTPISPIDCFASIFLFSFQNAYLTNPSTHIVPRTPLALVLQGGLPLRLVWKQIQHDHARREPAEDGAKHCGDKRKVCVCVYVCMVGGPSVQRD
jgi:hypothetical protein